MAFSKIYVTFAFKPSLRQCVPAFEGLITNHKQNYYGFTHYRPPVGAAQVEYYAQ